MLRWVASSLVVQIIAYLSSRLAPFSVLLNFHRLVLVHKFLVYFPKNLRACLLGVSSSPPSGSKLEVKFGFSRSRRCVVPSAVRLTLFEFVTYLSSFLGVYFSCISFRSRYTFLSSFVYFLRISYSGAFFGSSFAVPSGSTTMLISSVSTLHFPPSSSMSVPPTLCCSRSHTSFPISMHPIGARGI